MIMRRSCSFCGDSFPAKSSKALYCSGKCRTAATRARQAADRPTVTRPAGTTADRVRAELDTAGRLDTYLGAAALALAERIDASTAVMGFAALVKELRSTMDAALAGVTQAADPIDELRARRDRKRAG